MRILSRLFWWLLGAVVFFTVFAFALNNREPVVVHWFFSYQTRIQLVLLVLAVFVLGCATTVLAMLPFWWRQYRKNRMAIAAAPTASSSVNFPAAATSRATTSIKPASKSTRKAQEEIIDAV